MSDLNVNAEVVNSNQTSDQKSNDKEINFARLRQDRDRAVEAYNSLKNELDSLKSQIQSSQVSQNDDSDDSVNDIYEEVKKLKRDLRETKKAAQQEAKKLFDEERKSLAKYKLKTDYPDFESVVTPEIADKLVEKNPRLAEMLARIPEEERLPLLYETVKLSGIHKKPEPAAPQIQDQINKNMRNPYYMPAAVGHGSSSASDFSPTGQKSAYEQMKQLMSRISNSR